MSCPSPDELEALLAVGETNDSVRATAVLAHTRECPRCRAWLAGGAGEVSWPTENDARAGVASRAARRPRVSIVVLGVVGLGLVVASRTCGPRRSGAAGGVQVAPVGSS